MAPILAPIFWGTFFGGSYFPQKWVLLPPFQPRFKLFQGHVLSYQVDSTPGRFVWATPSLLLARTYFIIALNMSFVSWESTPARVKASEKGAKLYLRGDH
jgi:hypothetical protein